MGTALMLQALQPTPPRAAVPSPAPPRPAETLRPADPAKAVETFKATCWAHLRDEAALGEAAATAPIALRPQPRSTGPTHNWRAADGALSYAADLPAGVPAPQCILRVHLAGLADQLSLAAQISTALALPGGRTRAAVNGADTTWDVAQADGRTARLIAGTRPAAGGGTSFRLTALLLTTTPTSPQ